MEKWDYGEAGRSLKINCLSVFSTKVFHLQAEQMFRTIAEAKGECLIPEKLIKATPGNLFHGGMSVVVPQYYILLCPCVYGTQHYGQLPIMLSVLFCFVN